jgi:hypothetical protein
MRKMHGLLLLVPVVASSSAIAAACGGSNEAEVPGTGDAASEATTNADATGSASSDAADDGATDAGPLECTDFNALKNPYFGDLHAHTSFSFDAYTFDTRNTPFDAYAFARGETLQVAGAAPGGGGPMTTIERPLDFLALTDHSEWLALSFGCGEAPDGSAYDPQSPYFGSTECLRYRSTDPTIQSTTFGNAGMIQARVCDAGKCPPVVRSAWQTVQQAAASAYVPCKFTSFVAYEWTHAVAGATLHKNVIFGTDKVPEQPVDSFNYPSQIALWGGLDQACTAANGCEVITIPHNSNLSQGGAFSIPAGAEAQAAKYQKLVEIFQHKGGSECFFDPNNPTDPTCEFEYLGGVTEPNDTNSYVRTGLERGLERYAASASKVNPLQMGIVAATDDHNGTPGNTRESTWPGHAGRLDDTPQRRIGPSADGGAPPAVSAGHNPGGVAVAWAEQNTRDAIFAAFQRRETYGTSGPRMTVRFYQTWASGDPCADPNFPAEIVANGGVPMGGTFGLPAPDAGGGTSEPTFVVYAWKDKVDLARVDIVKAWIDGAGKVQEKLVKNDVVAGKPACFTFTDTAFTPSPTFYYARVLETPTPRWSHYDCAAGVNQAACADGGGLDVTIQERAWTSPIWYLP